MTQERIENNKKDAEEILQDFMSLGLSLEVAKKAAIKSIRRTIDVIDLIDGIHFVGLKAMMDNRRQMILFIIDK